MHILNVTVNRFRLVLLAGKGDQVQSSIRTLCSDLPSASNIVLHPHQEFGEGEGHWSNSVSTCLKITYPCLILHLSLQMRIGTSESFSRIRRNTSVAVDRGNIKSEITSHNRKVFAISSPSCHHSPRRLPKRSAANRGNKTDTWARLHQQDCIVDLLPSKNAGPEYYMSLD